MDIQRLKQRAAADNNWQDVIPALEEIETRLGQAEAENRELRQLWSETETAVVQLRSRLDVIDAVGAREMAEKQGGADGKA